MQPGLKRLVAIAGQIRDALVERGLTESVDVEAKVSAFIGLNELDQVLGNLMIRLDLHKTLGVAAITPEPEIASPPLPSVSQGRITVLNRQITVLEHERDGIH